MTNNSDQTINQPDIKPIGAVMVVGGGIAGMQASLDLADQGFKVYLIEKETAIGGKMAQLDKTFPTNDCAMCTISPKLVETGRHPNISILTNTEVMEIRGQAGNFNVRIHQQPRYINMDKCVACGDCIKACPSIAPDSFNEGITDRKAIYKLYPQAVPNAFAVQKRGIAPCRDACPSGQRVQGYIALTREGRWEDAFRVIKIDNPFPGICGRICNHRCETACNRGIVDEPINIRALKRFVTDKIYATPRQPLEPVPHTQTKQVAIIGAGPCGLTAAKDLTLQGYPVTVFEAMPVAGGMLRLGVPEYRLPTEIVDREVQDIVDLGVDLRLNHQVDNLDQLFDQGFEAVLIAVGAHEGIRLRIPGADLDGVLVNTHFLRDIRLGKYAHTSDDNKSSNEPILGKHVLVLGGGNVAIDCARSAVRLGCQVQLACLEDRNSMPAHDWEIQAAEEEGVTIYPSRTFEQILGDKNSRVIGVECMDVASFNFDDLGRLQVEKIPGTKKELPCDTVIFSVGQRAGLAFIPDDAGVGITERQTIAINPNTMAATRPGVFAAGDSVSGTAFVIEAVDSGHKAAQSILRYLQGEDLEQAPKPELPVVNLSQQEINERIRIGEIKLQKRIPMPQLSVCQRIENFVEVEGGYEDESAQAEAARCLSCGVCSECMSCVEVCGVNAINHDMPSKEMNIEVGAIILAPGYQIFNPRLNEEFGFGRYPNVVTALQYERMLSASGPTKGHIQRPSDGNYPKRIAFLQCIGSRDQNHDYCSSVCCMYAAKEAIMTLEHARAETHDENYNGVTCKVFFMDTRAFSKGYEEYYHRAKNKYGVEYIRCRLSDLKEDPITHNIKIRYSSPFAGSNEIVQEDFDLVVLSVGMEISDSVKDLSRRLGIELDEYGFCHTTLFHPLQTSRQGIFVAGPFREPKDIPETVVEASGAAANAAKILGPARFSLTTVTEYPPERDVSSEETRIGIFVCHCGSNIGGYLDVPGVAEYARTLPCVVHAENNLYTCSQDTIAHIIEQIKSLQLNRVVVASCTPITHESLFQDALRHAGLNPHLFDMANIRNQCSWVHANDWEGATKKAKSLVRMAIARASSLQSLEVTEAQVNNAALIIGGGIAGITASLTLAEQGFKVYLVERENELGGNLRNLRFFLPSDNGFENSSPQEYLLEMVKKVTQHPLIKVYRNTTLTDTSGFLGNFTSILSCNGNTFQVEHGVTIVASGATEYKGHEYGYGTDKHILTQLEFEQLLSHNQTSKLHPNPNKHSEFSEKAPSSVVIIQCIGPAEKYCSRLCCTTSLKNALKLKEINPESQITILYHDIRTYGFKERLYTKARQVGVRFIHYDFENKPKVEIQTSQSSILVKVWDQVLGVGVNLKPELLVLSTPIVPQSDMRELASKLKLSTDMDGYFLEAHVKLRPVDFNADGIFMAGMAHYPKFLDETITQAEAAASRAARILAKKTILTNARIAIVNQEKCVGCLTCVRICPYNVPTVRNDFSGIGNLLGAAYIERAICHGCGICASECPAMAIQLMHCTDDQVLNKVDAIIEPHGIKEPNFIPVEKIEARS